MTRCDTTCMQVVRIAAADGRAAHTATQQVLPIREGSGIQLRPGSVPYLDGVEATVDGVLPGRSERLRVAHAHDGPALRSRSHRPLHRLRLRLAEIPTADPAPGVPVPTGGRDLESGEDDRQATAAGSVGELMTDIVVIGHAEEIEAGLSSRGQHLLGPRVTVGIERVAVEVAAQPSCTRLGQRVGIDPPHGAGHPPRRVESPIEPDLDLPVAAAGSDLVWTEEHVPRARADLPLSVRRRGPGLVDRELHLVAAAPAAEPRARFRDAALVEEPDIERVAAGNERV